MHKADLIPFVIVVLAIVLIFTLLYMRRDKSKPTSTSRPHPAENRGVASAAAAAVEDVAGPLVGIDAHPDLSGPPDDLTTIKGLGPKAAAQLKLLGITRFAQLGSLDTAQCRALDEQMGVFRGRLERDRWVEQARYLARGDTTSFEREFGKLG